MAKPDKTPRCYCGKVLPCPDHTGDDGDTIDGYIPEEFLGRGKKEN